MLISQNGLADSKWGLSEDTENRLSTALKLVNTQKLIKQNRVGTNFVTVGDDGACDFRVGANRIQSAIDSGAEEIRIASNATYEENIVINTFAINLSIRGGFADCTQAYNNNQSDAIIDRAEITRLSGEVTSVFSIRNLPSNIVTTFENLIITGGDSNEQGSGGSVGLSETDSDVIFNNVWMTGANKSFTGGGLSVVSSNSTVILNHTDIFNNNVAGSGGGIYCNNFTAQPKFSSIIITETSNLYANIAGGSGGGALIGEDCLLSSFSGSSVLFGEKGIYNNSATDNGGAVQVFGGGGLLIYGHILCDLSNNCFGNSSDPASVYGNQANAFLNTNRNGGAIDASGTGTDVTIIAGHVFSNSIDQSLTDFGAGGAISLKSQATLNVSHPGLSNSTVACWDLDRCNLFNFNSAHIGGVIYTNDSNVNISHAVFENNEANNGMAFYFSGNEVISIENSIINNNGENGNGNHDDDNLIHVAGNTTLNMSYTTIADNDSDQVVFEVGPSATLNLHSSIVHDVNSGNVIGPTSGTIVSNCVMAHEISSFTGTNNALDDPEFIDRANKNYHLNATISPAIDYCHILPSILNKDIDYQERGFDNLALSNFLGTYDIGADESYAKTFLTVGADQACDFNTATQSIQDAVDTGVGEVRIAANGVHNKKTLILNKNMKIRGGYSDCTAANNDNQATRTDIVITEGSTESAISISGASQRNNITLENLNLTGKGTSAVRINQANADILIKNVTVQNTELDSGGGIPMQVLGGGISVFLGNVNLNLIDTIITQNTASHGGGLYCNSSGSRIVMSGNSGISQNTTAGKGGGVFITDGCYFTLYSGTNNPTELSTIGISANIADEEGGGIYVDGGGKVILNGHRDCSQQCIGDNTSPVNVNHNKSNGGSSGGERGGGIYMTGSGTKVSVYAGLFSENLSPNGGAIYVNDFANLDVERLFKECWDTVRCNYFNKNRAFATGGAIQNDQGFINISSAYFEENIGSTGSVLYAFGSNSHNNFESTVFNRNSTTGSDDFVIRAAVSSNVEISHSTFADNFISNSSVFGITTDSELRLYSSIVHEPDGDVLNDNPGNVVSDCLMVHEAFSLSGTNSTNLYLNDPEFVDRDNRDYHLSMDTSPAIDVCDTSMSNIHFRDIDFDEFGTDDINVNDISGPFDIGADEAVVNDRIFKNGFE